MKVFITGSTGFIGFAVAQAVRRAGHEVYGLTRSAEKARLLSENEVFPVSGSLEQPDSYLKVAERCNVLIHAAMDYESDTVLKDRLAVESLLESCKKRPQPKNLIFTSGVWVYGNRGDEILTETSSLRPPAHVAWRPEHEQLVLQASHARGIVIRPGCVYGKQGSLTAMWFQPAWRKQILHIVGDGNNRWPLVHVDDLADAYLRVVESEMTAEIWNVTDRSRFRVREMVEAVAQITGYSGEILYTPVEEAAKRMGTLAECLTLDQQVDSTKMIRKLGWQPRHAGFVDGMEAYFESWRAFET